MKTRLIGIALLGLLLGCVNPTPRVERHFGESVRANAAAHVMYPAAAANTNPAIGLDGRAARNAHERYERSFAEKERNTMPALFGTMGGGK
jgi:hypothetical protein